MTRLMSPVESAQICMIDTSNLLLEFLQVWSVFLPVSPFYTLRGVGVISVPGTTFISEYLVVAIGVLYNSV